MADSDRLLKKQTNFLISNFREFHKLWRYNQEAILKFKCCDGKLTINFESSFKVPEWNPIRLFQQKWTRKSWEYRRAGGDAMRLVQSFPEKKASKDNVDEIPTPAKEDQEEMQVSVVSPESA